jgi:hypothetical protein
MFAVPIFVMVNRIRKVDDSQGDCGNNWTENYRGEVLVLNSFFLLGTRDYVLFIVRASFLPFCLFVITLHIIQ